MFQDMLSILAAGANRPVIDNAAIEWFKDLVNYLSKPKFSLPLFSVLFVIMLLTYRKWTRPAVSLLIMIAFLVVYFGSMFIDHNYLLIIVKPDNVPITIMVICTGLCLWVALRQAAANDQRLEEGRPLIEAGRDDKVLVWPDLVYIELICLVLASALLIIWAVVLRAPLESPANPAGPPNPSKAPWYFLGLQEMLVYFDPWMAGVVLPGMIVTGLIGLPFIDNNPKGAGYYTLGQRRFAISIWLFGFLILWMLLIVFGTFLRGPNWNFFGPYQYWDAHMQVPLTNVNVSQYFWEMMLDKAVPDKELVAWAKWGPMVPFIREFVGIVLVLAWVFGLPVILKQTVLRHMYQQMGSARFYFMVFHLVIMGLLPLKMVLRWLFNLKYFVYLPEFNLNL